MRKPINFAAWLHDHQDKLRPPVGNQQIWSDGQLIVTVVGAPNQRSDFHDDPFDEYFHQFRGNAHILVIDRGKFERINLNEGDIFLLPAHIRHSPQRPEARSLCTVIEIPRPDGIKDGFEWYCAHCHELVARHEVQIASITEDLPKTFQKFYATNDQERTCKSCGEIHPGRDFAKWHQRFSGTLRKL